MPPSERIEKRVTVAAPIYLNRVPESGTFEKGLTENVSPRGARVVTWHSWQPGDEPRLTPPSCEFHLSARVIYCQPVREGLFSVGLQFCKFSAQWWDKNSVGPSFYPETALRSSETVIE
jgi:hypothetical protein